MSNVEEIKIKDAVEPCKFNFSCDDVIDPDILLLFFFLKSS